MSNSSQNSYQIRPPTDERFSVSKAKEVLEEILKEELSHRKYDPGEVDFIIRKLGDTLRSKIKGTASERYKYLVHIALCENKGEGLKMCCRCLWDADTDNYASYTFTSDSIICVATAFAVYYY